MAEEKSKTIQLVASSVAAVAAAFVGSRLGVVGTAMGAGLGSAVTMGVSSLTEGGLSRTSVKLRRRLTAHEKAEDAPTVLIRPVLTTKRRPFPMKWAIIGAASAFVVAMGLLTVVELGLGRPVSGGNEGTTLTGLVGGATSHYTAPVTSTETLVPTTSVEPSTSLSGSSSTLSSSPTTSSSLETTAPTSLLSTTVTTSAPPTSTTPPLMPSAR